jgi:hypothetical protein
MADQTSFGYVTVEVVDEGIAGLMDVLGVMVALKN